jgi:hypothetical protein
MALTHGDLQAIEQIITRKLEPIQADLKEIKIDLKFLAALNQLEEIKKDPRLKRLYEGVS